MIAIGNRIGRNSGGVSCTPRNIVIARITGGNRITFDQKCPETETEIWASIDGGTLTFVTTLAPTVETYDHLPGVDFGSISYRLRSKLDETVLNAPANLQIAVTATGVTLTWDDNNADAEYIRIYEKQNAGAYSLLDTIAVGVETYDRTLYDVEGYYKLMAIEGTLPVTSSYSNEVHATAPASYETEAVALFNRMIAEGETPTDARKTIINDLWVAMKGHSYLAGSDVIILGAGKGENSRYFNILGDVHNASKISTPVYTEDHGIATDGSSTQVEIDFTPSTAGGHYALNSVGVFYHIRTAQTKNTLYTGARVSTTGWLMLGNKSGANMSSYINDQTAYNSPAYGATGFFGFRRTASDNKKKNYKKATIGGATTSGESAAINPTSMPSNKVRLGGYNYTTVTYNDGEFTIYRLGAEFTDQDFEDMCTDFGAYLTSIGAI